MSPSIKVSENTKGLLDKTRAKITLRIGGEMPLSDIVEAIIRVSLNHEDELLEAIRKISVGESVSDELLQLAADWGVKTRSEEIDECLYAHQSRRRKVH